MCVFPEASPSPEERVHHSEAKRVSIKSKTEKYQNFFFFHVLPICTEILPTLVSFWPGSLLKSLSGDKVKSTEA